jgi:tetratricopeptide (TPR) repeat protein
MVRRVLLKHDYETVRRAFLRAGYERRLTAWGLMSFAIFREEYDRALELLSEAEGLITDPGEVLEPHGPWPFAEGWRSAFHRGTLLLLSGQAEDALVFLRRAYALHHRPEAANNLGVALALTGHPQDAQERFSAALDRSPGYADALQNQADPKAGRITSHPFRMIPSRSEYV